MKILPPPIVNELIFPDGIYPAGGSNVPETDFDNSHVVTINNSTPNAATISWVSHNLTADTPVSFTTTGALPAGILAFPNMYYVAPSPALDTFNLLSKTQPHSVVTISLASPSVVS